MNEKNGNEERMRGDGRERLKVRNILENILTQENINEKEGKWERKENN